jgi:putative ABC transport system permease protein
VSFLKNHIPPRWSLRLLKWFSPDHLYEEIEGDLIQKFSRDAKEFGERRAKRRLLWNVIRFFRPGILLRNKFTVQLNQGYMFNHFLKVLFRNALKNKIYSALNVVGLTLGMSAFILIGLHVWNERSYDDFHAKKSEIFRVRQDRYTDGVLSRQWTAGAWSIGVDLKNNFPEVLRYVNVNKNGLQSAVLSNENIFFKEERLFYASEDFFDIFSYPLIKGVDSLVLLKPFTMVVSESLAKRYFGDDDPIGKSLKCNGSNEFEITGVFKDAPENTHLKFDALFSFESLLKIIGPEDTQNLMTNWGWSGNYCYIELAPSASVKLLEAKIPALVEKKMGKELRAWGEGMSFAMQPLSSIHLDSNFKDEIEPNGDRQSTNFLALIAIFILGMAWVNYINLSTARAIERTKEVGVRKVLGSGYGLLIRQFLFEAFTFKLLAVMLTALFVAILLPSFSTFLNQKIDLSMFSEKRTWLYLLGIFLLGVLASGIYPAFVMSGFNPVQVLKGRFQSSASGHYLRKGLISFQFISSVVLMVGTFVVYQQIDFMRSSALGIDKEQMLIVQGPAIKDSTYYRKFDFFRESLLSYPDIQKITVSTDVPGQSVKASNGQVRLVGQDLKLGNTYRVVMSDEDFPETYGMQLMAGRMFSREFNDHWNAALVNETAMQLFGYNDPEKIIGQKAFLWDDTIKIVGVLKNYHQESLKSKVDQLIFICDKEISNYYTVKIRTNKSLATMVRTVEEKYKGAFPDNPFQYFFLDDYFNLQYQSDVQFGKVFGLFSLLAIIIACLGLFGLSSYLVLQRTKEIGIRKVLGATVVQITSLVSKEFILIVLISNIIAWPIAFYTMDFWLRGFAFRIDLGVFSFVLPTAITLLIATLTVATQSIKAARANPTINLRAE